MAKKTTPEERPRKGAASADEKPKETPMEFISSMAAVLVTGLFIVTFNMQAFEIPSSSMVKTLLIGDHVFVDRTTAAPRASWTGPLMPYREVRRGDIVVFISPAEPGLHVVKRVIGVPGDRIRLHQGTVYRNGQRVDEPYVVRDGSYRTYRDEFPSVEPETGSITQEWQVELSSHVRNGELVVPPDSYFGMGDNRDVSYDSRFWGFIPRENVIGRPMFIYWSFETPEDQYKRTEMSDRAGFLVHVALHFFDKTRWRRTLNWVH